MTHPKPYTPALCICGCGSPARRHSKYASSQCEWRYRKQNEQARPHTFVKCAEEGCASSRHAGGLYCRKHCKRTAHYTKQQIATWQETAHDVITAVHAKPRGVLIYYKECSEPDHMSRTMAEKCIKAGDFRPGDVIMMDGKRIEITPRTRSDEKAKQVRML